MGLGNPNDLVLSVKGSKCVVVGPRGTWGSACGDPCRGAPPTLPPSGPASQTGSLGMPVGWGAAPPAYLRRERSPGPSVRVLSVDWSNRDKAESYRDGEEP